MKARDVIGRRIVAVEQHRVSRRDVGADPPDWEVDAFILDNGARVYFLALETEVEPIVVAGVAKPKRSPSVKP